MFPQEYVTHTHLQHLAIQYLLPNNVFQPRKLAEQPIQCTNCPKLLTPQKTWSNCNGNQGRFYVSMTIHIIPSFTSLIFVLFSAKELVNNPTCHFSVLLGILSSCQLLHHQGLSPIHYRTGYGICPPKFNSTWLL